MDHQLNQRAAKLCEKALLQAEPLGIECGHSASGTRLLDFGIASAGSLEAGLLLARVCLADLASVTLEDARVCVETEHPIAACLASQYAGWEIKGEKFFAMGSGPMRAVAGREPLFEEIGCRERSDVCVGVIESSKLPTDAVCCEIAEKCGIGSEQLTLLVAPTSSIAGTLQVVARSVETALHKLHALEFDLSRVVDGGGSAPLVPVAEDDLASIGRTNDAILYGGEVKLTVRGDDNSLEAVGPRTPSSASPDYGRPFAEILARYDNDFYQVDPLLFSAAVVVLENIDTGNSFRFGELNPDVLQQSLGG